MPLAKLKRGFAGKWAVLPGFAMLFLSGICWAASVGRVSAPPPTAVRFLPSLASAPAMQGVASRARAS